jgi:hemolysin III
MQANLEERLNVLTHGFGILLFGLGTPWLIYAAMEQGAPTRIWAVSIFCFTLIFTYLASTVYHAVRHPQLKKRLQVVDHISIYGLIAGTYTPFILFFFQGDAIWQNLLLIWGIALAGTLYKLFLTGRFKLFSTFVYLGMGWLIVLIGKPIFVSLTPIGLTWLILGGAAYSLGVIFFLMPRLRYHHAIWHLFVLAGSTSHFLAVLESVGSKG